MPMRSCVVFAALVAATAARADDWPQWMGPRRDGTWAETGVLTAMPPGGPKRLWSAPVHGGYAGPAVAGGKVFVTDFDAGVVGGDPGKRATLSGNERVLCHDTKTGGKLWEHKYPCKYTVSYACGPRCTPTVDGDRVYT